jgi:glycosyltransferase involved in cell wall biosynthesis
MKILMDLSFIKDGNTSIGFTRVALNLLSGFIKIGLTQDITVLVDRSSKNYFETAFNSLKVVVWSNSTNFWEKFFPYRKKRELKRFVENESIDLLFCPFINFNTLTIQSCKSVGILHDVQKVKLMRQKKGIIGIFYKIRMGKVIKSFSHLVTISESERKHILSIYPSIFQRLSVIHNGVEIMNKEVPVRELENIHEYILDVNTLYEYKNPMVLIKAFQRISDKIPHLLVFKGKLTPYWEQQVIPYIAVHNLDRRVLVIERILSDEEMAYLYKHASVFVSPSRMEGFGLTPVEAALYGAPIICSNIDTLEETTLGLADYFDPDDEVLLSELIMKNISTPKHNNKVLSERFIFEYSVQTQVIRYKNLFDSI